MEYYLFIDTEYHMELVDIEDYNRVQDDFENISSRNVTSDESNI